MCHPSHLVSTRFLSRRSSEIYWGKYPSSRINRCTVKARTAGGECASDWNLLVNACDEKQSLGREAGIKLCFQFIENSLQIVILALLSSRNHN